MTNPLLLSQAELPLGNAILVPACSLRASVGKIDYDGDRKTVMGRGLTLDFSSGQAFQVDWYLLRVSRSQIPRHRGMSEDRV